MLNTDRVNAQLAAIKQRHSDYRQEPEALTEASAVWGGGHGPHGTFTPCPLEIVAEHERTRAGVRVTESPSGLFAYGLDFAGRESGFGYFPSVWREAFGSREEATCAAVIELLERLGEDGSGGKTAQEEIEHVRRLLRARLRPKQQDLFAFGLPDEEGGSAPPANDGGRSPAPDEPAPDGAATV